MSKARNLSDFISDAAIDATEIGSNAVTTDKIIDQAVTPAKLHNTLDLSSKTVTLPTGGISGNAIDGGVISNFASTGIDDNASATAVTIDGSGRVGIGTLNPQAQLHINTTRTSSTNATSFILSDNVTGAQTDGVYKSIRSTSNNGNSISEIRFVETDGTNNNTAIAFATQSTAGGLTERLRVHRDGNVGIGTTDPSAPLHIKVAGSGGALTDAVQIRDSSEYVGIAMYVGAADGEIRVGAAGQLRGRYAAQYAGTRSAHSFAIGTNNTTAISIDDAQNTSVLISDSNTTQSTLKGLVVSNSNGTTNNGSAISFAYGSNGNSFSKIGVINTDRTGGSEDQDIFFGNLGGGSYSESMRIDSSGNVGIGVTPVTSWDTFTALQIEGSALGGLGDNNTILGSNLYHDNNAFKYIGSATASIYQQRLGEHRWYGAASGTAGNTASLTQHMTIDSSGSVGIGSTNPIGSAQKLYIEHPAGLQTSLPTVKIKRANNVGGGSAIPEIALDVSVPSTYNNATEVYGIKTYAAHNLTGTGCFGIYSEVEKGNGDNHHAGFFRGGHSDTNGISIPKVIYIDQTTNVGVSNSGYSIGCMIKQDDYVKNEFMRWQTDYSGSWTMNALRIYRNGSQIGGITTATSSTSYNTSSDYRLKENITDVTDGITRVKQLAPKRFNFIAEPDKFVDGFIAHEAQAVVPEAVTGTQDALDAEGNPDYQGIDQSKLVPLLTAALQEAIAKIEILETEMTSAKARIAALEE